MITPEVLTAEDTKSFAYGGILCEEKAGCQHHHMKPWPLTPVTLLLSYTSTHEHATRLDCGRNQALALQSAALCAHLKFQRSSN